MRAKTLMVAVLTTCVAACATTYAPNSFWNDGGFSETEVQPGLWQVRFQGNEFTDAARTSDFAMLRAAELCLSRGQAFMYLGDVATEVVQSGYIPGTTTSTTTGSATAYGSGNSATVYGSSTTNSYTSPGTALYRPETGLTVACAEEKGPSAWDAAFLKQSMKSKYQITEP